MSLVAVCKKCGCKIRAKQEHAGRQFRCPECNALNQLPCGQQSPSTDAEQASAVCLVCGFDLWIDPDQVEDSRGRRFHRECFKEISPKRMPRLADSDVVQLSQSPRTEKPKPSPPQPAPRPKARARATSAAKPQPLRKPPPSRPKEPTPNPPDVEDDDLLLATPVEPSNGYDELPEAIPDALPNALPEALPEAFPDALPDALLEAIPDALPEAWPEAEALAPLPGAAVFQPSRSPEQPKWFYLLIGFGAAVPVILVVLLVVQIGTKHGKASPTVSTDKTADRASRQPHNPQADTTANADAPAAQVRGGATWQPDPGMLEELGPYEDFEGYQMRLPKSFPRQASPQAPPGGKVFLWAGLPRGDGTRPLILISVIAIPPRERKMGAKQAHANYLAGMKRSHDHWQEQPMRSGEINGMAFLKTTLQATVRANGLRMHAVVYGHTEGATFVEMSGHDVEPHQEQTLKIIETAMLTFRKKP